MMDCPDWLKAEYGKDRFQFMKRQEMKEKYGRQKRLLLYNEQGIVIDSRRDLEDELKNIGFSY